MKKALKISNILNKINKKKKTPTQLFQLLRKRQDECT